VSKVTRFDDEPTILDNAVWTPVEPSDLPVNTTPTNPPPVVPEEGLSARLKKK
jgi:hypothetical protein